YTPKSFDFDQDQATIALAIRTSSNLIAKMIAEDGENGVDNSGFVTFSKSDDFDVHVATQLFKQESTLDGGALMAQLYDQNMSNAQVLEGMNEQAVVQKANTNNPIY
ncbi:hypothetical protein, partial [Vibrio sp. 10N.222.52.B7]|uniref:hypothetical protein n=1 Tax=Vibrio sp. 10N.222.52.B7 TaxID=3229629 RepID=UPI00354DDC15